MAGVLTYFASQVSVVIFSHGNNKEGYYYVQSRYDIIMYLFFRMVQRFENETMKEPYKLLNGENAFGDHSILLSRSQHYVRYEIFITTLPLFSNRNLQ